MSGTVRVRKQWQLQEGPNGTLRRLRCQLAEDGCVDSQVVVAKQLLEEAQLGGDFTEQTEHAVHWLTRATEFGNEEAAGLLRKCYRSGTGITKENFVSVRLCLAMSAEEKALRTAARDLFTDLTPFGQDFVTTNQLQARLKQLDQNDNASESSPEKDKTSDRDSPDSSFTKWYQDSGIFDGQCLTEAGLIEAASRVARGEMPDISLLEEERRRTKQRTFFRNEVMNMLWQRWISLPIRPLDLIAKYGEATLGLLTWSHARIVLLVLLCNVLTMATVCHLLPVAAFYLAFAIMFLSTVQLLRQRRGLKIVEQWVLLFRTAHSELDTDRLQQTFHRRRLRRCHFRYFASALVALISYPLSDTQLILHADLASAAIGLSIVCLVGIDRPICRTIAFIALLLANVLSRLQMLSATEWTTTMELSPHLNLTLSPDLFPGIAIAAYLSWTARRVGVYRSALSDAVVLVWSQFACTLVSDAQAGWTEFCRGAMVWASVLGFPLVVAVAAAAIMLYMLWTIAQVVGQWGIDYMVVVPTVVLVVLATVWWRKRRKVNAEDGGVAERVGVRRSWLALSIITLLGLSALFLSFSQDVILSSEANKLELPLAKDNHVGLTWDTYHRLCHQTSRTKLSAAVVAERCSLFAGTPVRWRGQVRDVVMIATSNPLEDLLELFPDRIAEYLRCLFGDQYSRCDPDTTRGDGGANLDADEFFSFWYCRALDGLERHCHLRRWDRHEFEISVRIRSEGYWNPVSVVHLRAGHYFRDFATNLVPGDEVSFSGVLLRAGPAGSSHPAVLAKSITCLDCSRDDLKPCTVEEVDGRLWEAFGRSLCSVVNHLFHPFLQYRPATNKSTSNL